MKNLFLNVNSAVNYYNEFKAEQQTDDFISEADVEQFNQVKHFLENVSLFHTLFVIEKIFEIILTFSLMLLAPLWDTGYLFSDTSGWNLLLFPYFIIFIASLALAFLDWRFPFSFSKDDVKKNLD